ncbi:hypothetical protein N9D32_02120 [Candidatus Pelagibacter sp.]|nr:hypothetical protein [Candidatus Pelagibacter sp.]
MKKPLIINTLSILVSLLFPLTALLGMMAGQIGSRLFSSLFSSSVGYGQIGGEFIFFIISGYCAGYFSAFVISKVYKNFNFNYALIIPVLMMVYFGYQNILESSQVSLSFLINSTARDLVMLITYYYILGDKKF